ncbi:hypothetical protein ACO2Q8_07185 [Larkinella sp. VNQ87]|uniref:hypothetical protein n=1 Tax=Larkinella sp. VNQ87 TaxID=3400921 RepID=UPI003C107237
MYTETQKFRQPWAWVLLLACLGVVLYAGQLGGILIVLAVIALFWFLKLETVIDHEGIAFRWFPFQPRFYRIPWTDMEQITVRKYSGLGEFGGWGMRIGWQGNAQTTSGNWGIQINRKGKKRFLLIGTQRPDAVRTILGTRQLLQV